MFIIEGLNAWYGKSHILHNVDLNVSEGQVISLLGRNGVGKTTLLKAIMGLVHRAADTKRLGELELSNLSADLISRSGIGYVPQTRNIFPDLTVYENLVLAHHQKVLSADKMDSAIHHFPVLREKLKQLAGRLSGGEQQMLALSRVLTNEPRLLLLDEPVEGLMPQFVSRISEVVKSERARGVSIILVEQNVKLALELADQVFFMEKGSIKHSCGPEDCADGVAIARYLGVGINLETPGEKRS